MKTNMIIEPHYKHSRITTMLPEPRKGLGILSFEERAISEIKEALVKYTKIDPENIGIEINKHTIHLMGMVSSQNEKNDAETVAWICLPDATEVINDLKVDEENESTEVFEF
jgi:hypothetical protein